MVMTIEMSRVLVTGELCSIADMVYMWCVSRKWGIVVLLDSIIAKDRLNSPGRSSTLQYLEDTFQNNRGRRWWRVSSDSLEEWCNWTVLIADRCSWSTAGWGCRPGFKHAQTDTLDTRDRCWTLGLKGHIDDARISTYPAGAMWYCWRRRRAERRRRW